MHFSGTAKNKTILTAISTTVVNARTRRVSKKVNRFLLVGRGVRKKLTRATQLRFPAAKESRQRSKFTAAISRVLWSYLSFQPRNWAGVRRFSDSCDTLLSFGQGSELWPEHPDFLILFRLSYGRGTKRLLTLSYVFSHVLSDGQWTVWPQLGDSLWHGR